MGKTFDTILKEIRRGENLDFYLMILLASIVAVLNLLQHEVVSAVTLAILSLLAYSFLTARRSMADIKEALDQLASTVRILQQRGHISDLLRRAYPDFTEHFRTAERVSIGGSTLMSTVQRYSAEFKQLLQSGGSLRVLVSEPVPEVLAMQVFRSSSIKDPALMTSHIQANIAMMKSLADKVPHPELLEIRVMPYLASYSLAILEDKNGASKIYVKLLPFQRPEPESPTFEVDSHHDPEWSEFFLDQFDRMWESSRKV